MKCAVFGVRGRMGGMVVREAEGSSVEVIAGFDRGQKMVLPPETEVVIDFSSPAAWKDLDHLLEGSSAGLVSGTTGLDSSARALLDRWSGERAVFYSANMSPGVFVMKALLREARRMLGDRFDLEVVEIHHRNKADSPSGTALSLLEGMPDRMVFGRNPGSGTRQAGETGVHSLRGGDVYGEHQAHLLGDGERLCITHMATGRRVFALGALNASQFLAGRAPGLYGMEDLFGNHS
jgi:4-hydroxy-tetrahydrodipicolinate reductase